MYTMLCTVKRNFVDAKGEVKSTERCKSQPLGGTENVVKPFIIFLVNAGKKVRIAVDKEEELLKFVLGKNLLGH